MLDGSSISALTIIGAACFFAGHLCHPGSGQGRSLEVRCSCSEFQEVSSPFTLEQDEARVWWYAALGTLLFARAVGLLCGGFTTGMVSVA